MQRWVGLHQARRSREKKKDIRFPYAAESVSQVLGGLVFNYNIVSTEKPMPEARRRLKGWTHLLVNGIIWCHLWSLCLMGRN